MRNPAQLDVMVMERMGNRAGQGRWRSNEERKKWGQRTENSSHFLEGTECQKLSEGPSGKLCHACHFHRFPGERQM